MDRINFTQLCRQCKKDFKSFKIELSIYDEHGLYNISNEEILENFSFVCRYCDLLNVLDFQKICNPDTIGYIRREGKMNRQIDEIINNLFLLQIEKVNLLKK